MRRFLRVLACMLFMGGLAPAFAQQFNSDNWWVLPHGVGMGVLNEGQYYSSMYLGYGFAPGWEVDVASILYDEDGAGTTDHYATSAFVKRLIFEDEAQTSGLSLMMGIGSTPGYLESEALTRDLKSYWAYLPWTVSFFDNKLSWDIMPGVTYDTEYGAQDESAWGFLYSSRVALYGVVPQSALVAEVFGSEGDAYSEPQYKAGVRYESKHFIGAVTYGSALDGSQGAGLEFGIMVLTLPFF